MSRKAVATRFSLSEQIDPSNLKFNRILYYAILQKPILQPDDVIQAQTAAHT